jgi:hypothetical protein
MQKVLELLCGGTKAEDASIYLYEESVNCVYRISKTLVNDLVMEGE